MRSAMHAASQLPGREPTDVDDAPAPAVHVNQSLIMIYGPQREKACLWGFANNKGATQHPRSLISAFVIFVYWKVSYLDML